MKPWGIKSWICTTIAILPVLVIAYMVDDGHNRWWFLVAGGWAYVVGNVEGWWRGLEGTEP